MTKLAKEEINLLSAVEIYRLVLAGKVIKRFPSGFWQRPEALQNAKECTIFLLEEALKFSETEIKEELSGSLFKNNKLGGMLRICFDNSPYKIIDNAYPNRYKEWEFNNVPLGFWTKEKGVEATKWLIEDRLKLTESEIKEKLSVKLFQDNGLNGMLQNCFNNSVYKAINNAYPNRYKEWEFNNVPLGFWTKEKGIEATKWLIEDRLKLTEAEIKEKLSVKLFQDNGLNGMLQYCFDNSPYKAISSVYPNKYKENEFSYAPRRYINKDKSVELVRWLIEDKLALTDNDLKERLSIKLFKDNGLGGMLSCYFGDSPYKAINNAYPNKYKEWEFKQVSKGFWTKEKSIEATRWLIEDKLKFSEIELKEKLSAKLFRDNGLGGMLSCYFGDSPYKAINSAYPNKYKEWEFKQVSKGFWTKEKSIEATRWLIEDKLKFSEIELKEKLSAKLFRDNGLGGMLSCYFGDSPYKAINSAYPNKYKEWEFRNVPRGFWTKENAIKATRWLIEEKLKLTEIELKEKLTQKIFKDNGLWGMMHTCYNGSVYKAINSVYPNKFKKTDFKSCCDNKR